MMMNQTKLDEVRTIILSLLVSRKNAIPVPVLERDYYEVEQQRIPYRQFGHTDLVQFLQSMPDYFIVEHSNGNHYVRGRASDKSRHVQSLVGRQKGHKYQNKPSRFVAPPHTFNQRIPHMKPQRVRIAPDKLLLLMQYVKSSSNGLSLQVAAAYIQQLVPYISVSTQDLRDQLRELSHELYLDGNMIYSVQNNDLQGNVACVNQQPSVPPLWNESASPGNSESPLIIQATYAAGQEEFESEEGDGDYSDENDFLSAGCTSNSGNSQRRAKTSEQLAINLAQYAKYEQTPCMPNYNNVNNNIEIEENDYFATSQRNTEVGSIELLHDNMSKIISDRTKLRLEELLQKYPDGIWCAQLPDLYLKEYNVHLNYKELGFTSVREFTSYLPKIFYMTQINKTDDFILHSADKRPVVPKTEPTNMTQALHNRYDEHNTMQTQYVNVNDNAPIPSEVSPTITKRFAPKEVMNYGDDVKKISVTDLRNNRSYLEVYIVEVFHPNFFWIHLRENKKEFNKLMVALSDFYEYRRDKYTVAKVALKKDLHCACIYMNKWHRGVIKSVKPDFRVTVFFYDYGTLKTYAPEDIYYLHNSFSTLPAQAIACGLCNVKSTVSDRWKKSVIDKFIDKIADTLLAATIMTIDPKNNTMMIVLTDTSDDDKDVVINDWLVKEKLAQFGKTADAVDMASIMTYVVNNLNQLPTYCFADESLMPDNCYKTIATEEKHEVPLVPSGSTFPHYDNRPQQQTLRPPPGFPPLGEQRIPSNASTRSSQNDYSFANVSNASNASKTSVFGDAEATTTNPFLEDQQFIPSDIVKQMHMSIWNENKKFQIEVTNILYDLLEHSSLSIKDHIHLNKILMLISKILSEVKNNRSAVVKTSPVSNLTSEPTSNDIGSAQKAAYNLNGETAVNQELNVNTFLTSNPFGINGNDRPQSNATSLPTYGSNDFAFKSNWSQSSELSPHMQIPPSTSTTKSVPPVFNHIPPASNFLPKKDSQDGENVPLPPVSPAVSTNSSISNNFSEFLDDMNTQFANMLIDTNPFKYSMTNGTHIPETQNERTANDYDAVIASYLSTTNPQSNSLKTETANIHARSNCFTPVNNVGHANENYTTRIVYEAGPVMYNTQKKQTDANANAGQNACNSNFDNVQNAQSLKLGPCNKSASQVSQPANDIAALHTQHTVINNYNVTRENSQVENHVTWPSTYHVQGSQPIINNESIYYQQNCNANNLSSVPSQAWNQNKIPEHWPNTKFQNNIPLSSHNESATFGTSTALLRQDWNCNNGSKPVPRQMNEATDSSYIFKVKDDHDKERSMDTYTNFWHHTESGSIQNKNVACNNNPFIFQKIDSVRGVTFIFNFDQDGWILTHEFVETFTNLKLPSCLLATLEVLNIKVTFKEILRSEYPVQFSQLDGYPLNVPRDAERRIISLNLISLQAALALLHKLKIVSRDEIENAFKKNEFLDDSILPTLWTLIVIYRNLKRHIEHIKV